MWAESSVTVSCSFRTGSRLITAPCPRSMTPAHRLRQLPVRASTVSGRKSRSQNAQVPEQQEEKSQGNLGDLVARLLFGAATRLDRGTTHCLRCKGSGSVECSNCQGTGTVKPGAALRQKPLKKAAHLVQSILDRGVSYDNDWQVTNRCRKCRGFGRCTCPVCQGQGIRGLDE